MLLYFKELKHLHEKGNSERYILFNNTLILINKKRSWFDNNVPTVKQILKDDDNMMTYNDFDKTYKILSQFSSVFSDDFSTS